MNVKTLEDVLQTTPFKPFTIQVDNGSSIKVPHPDFFMMNKSKTAAVIVDGDHFKIVDIGHISSVTVSNVKRAAR